MATLTPSFTAFSYIASYFALILSAADVIFWLTIRFVNVAQASMKSPFVFLRS